MEGANGKILDTDDPKVVVKKVHRRNRPHQRSGSLTAEQQMRIQEAAHRFCSDAGFKILYVPRAWEPQRFQYKMDRISVDKPLDILKAKNHAVFEELKLFYSHSRRNFLFPADFELYEQPDGRIAMVDFDKFGKWLTTGEVHFPWGQVSDAKTLLEPIGLL